MHYTCNEVESLWSDADSFLNIFHRWKYSCSLDWLLWNISLSFSCCFVLFSCCFVLVFVLFCSHFRAVLFSFSCCFVLFWEKTSRPLPLDLHKNRNLSSPATLLKKRLWHRCFPVNFSKFLRTPCFIEHVQATAPGSTQTIQRNYRQIRWT